LQDAKFLGAGFYHVLPELGVLSLGDQSPKKYQGQDYLAKPSNYYIPTTSFYFPITFVKSLLY